MVTKENFKENKKCVIVLENFEISCTVEKVEEKRVLLRDNKLDAAQWFYYDSIKEVR